MRKRLLLFRQGFHACLIVTAWSTIGAEPLGELNTDHSDCKVQLLANDIRKLKRPAEFSEKVVLK